MPRVGEAAPHGALRGAVDVGVVEHEQRVLAAQLERRADQPASRLGAHLPADGGRPGERHIVCALDHGAADRRPVPRDDLPQASRQPRLDSDGPRQQRSQHRLDVGLVDDRVACDERGQVVGDRQGQRVVPR